MLKTEKPRRHMMNFVCLEPIGEKP